MTSDHIFVDCLAEFFDYKIVWQYGPSFKYNFELKVKFNFETEARTNFGCRIRLLYSVIESVPESDRKYYDSFPHFEDQIFNYLHPALQIFILFLFSSVCKVENAKLMINILIILK